MSGWRAGLGAGVVALAALACSDDKTVRRNVCEGQSYPAAPEGTKQIVHVSRCAAGGGDGSRENPYGTIGQGLDRVEAGGAVLVAPGEYDESVTMRRPASIIGGNSAGEEDSVVMKPPALGGGVEADLDESSGGGATVEGIAIRGAGRAGVWVRRGAVTLRRVAVRETVADGEGKFGYGVYVTGGALTMVDSEVSGSADAGLLFDGGRGAVSASQVKGNRLGGVWVQGASADVRVTDSVLEGNGLVGLGVFGGKVAATGNRIAATALVAVGIDRIGDGIIVATADDEPEATIEATLEANQVDDSGRVGVLFGRGARGSLRQSRVQRSGAQADFAAGVWLQAGAGGGGEGLLIEGNTIVDNRFVGLGLTTQARARVQNNLALSGTRRGTVFVGVGDVEIGDGLGVFEGAVAVASANVIENNERFGAILDQAGPGAAVTGNTIRANATIGVVVQNESSAPDLGGNDYSGNGLDQKKVAAGETPFAARTQEFRAR